MMRESGNRPLSQMSHSTWLTLAAVILSLGIFVATYFQYFMRHETGAAGSHAPLTIGVGSYFVLMCALNYLGLPSSPPLGRLARAAAVALIEVFAFVCLLMLLLLNTLGS
jgi:hypothetical protein